MADLSGLKERVELVDLRLKTAHGARERESAALMETWQQIQDRFVDQNAEITKLRGRIAELEDARDDLLQMVHGLLSAVEGGLDRMSDESVPQIRTMAANLLAESSGQTAPVESPFNSLLADAVSPVEATEAAPIQPGKANLHDDLLETIEQSIGAVPETGSSAEEYEFEQRDTSVASDFIKEPASPGIRDLVARIETAVGSEILDTHTDNAGDESGGQRYEEDDVLSRDLQEIEALRGELHGLRQRISSGAL
jgi:hypothetical protein